mmetsp:Transcript_40789/g.93934  ORF Transcript_40789/g.93934 Transcript_40789/m.93934 type:complete len:325 (-) Transcript_40789:104-1078(-)
MKFKAVVENDAGAGLHQQSMLHVLQAFQRLDRVSERKQTGGRTAGNLILKLTPDQFSFCHRGGPDEESQTWSHFHIKKLFREYRIESKRQNCIDLEVVIGSLVHVFTNGASSERMLMKLATARDGRSVLNFEFTLAGNAFDHSVFQEVPVRVVPHEEAEGIIEPRMPEPEYQLELKGSLTRFKGVLDKMRTVNAYSITVEAGMDAMSSTGAVAPSPADAVMSRTESGQGGKAWLKLEAETELVNISSTFPSLGVVCEGKEQPLPDRPVKLQLQLKRLAEVISAFQLVAAQSHIACLLENKALVLFTRLPQGFGSLISYSPIIAE